METTIEFDGFWSLTTPGEAAGLIAELYGVDAVKAAKECKEAAFADCRYDDCCFWRYVLDRLTDANQQPPTVLPS